MNAKTNHGARIATALIASLATIGHARALPDRETMVRGKIAELEAHPGVRWDLAKVRVRTYNRETVKATEYQFVRMPREATDHAQQRRVLVVNEREVDRVIGRAPPPKTYREHYTASLGNRTGCGESRAAALRALAELLC
jgi:hypothetical protein